MDENFYLNVRVQIPGDISLDKANLILESIEELLFIQLGITADKIDSSIKKDDQTK